MANRFNRRRSDNSSGGSHLEARVSALETAIGHIEIGMLDIKEALRTGITELKREIEDESNRHRPKFAVWASWAAVGLIVVGMLGSSYIRDLERIEATYSNNTLILRQHLTEDGHPQLRERLHFQEELTSKLLEVEKELIYREIDHLREVIELKTK